MTERVVYEPFDHNSRDYFHRRFGWFAEARGTGPVFWTPHNGGHWVVIGLSELQQATKDWESFSSEHTSEPVDGVLYGGSFIPPKNRASLLNDDPPVWNGLRQAMAPCFSAKALAPRRQRVQQFVDECIDRHLPTGRIDVVNELANPVPTMSIMELVGLPLDDWREWSRVLHLYAHLTPRADEYAQMMDDLAAAQAQLLRRVAEQRENPRDGLIAHLLTTEVSGGHLDNAGVAGIVRLVIGGGVDTTASTLAASIRVLYTDDELRARLMDDPSLMTTAVEELLRWATPTQGLCRTVTRDVELGGQQLRRGERIMLCFAGANRDPSAFADPDAIDLTRRPNRHVAFGSGLHRCIGAPLARIELEVVLDTVLRRLPDLRIDDKATCSYPNTGVVAGFVGMPATFQPRPAGSAVSSPMAVG
jgi:cytochrome P450